LRRSEGEGNLSSVRGLGPDLFAVNIKKKTVNNKQKKKNKKNIIKKKKTKKEIIKIEKK